MQGHIKAICMQDIQSWKGDEDKQFIRLDDDKLNVIIGRNETGKSVIAKVFKQMCFPNYFTTRGRRSLIRRGCDKGTVTIQLYNGTIIHFFIFPTYQAYRMRIEGEEEFRTWKQNSLPEEIREELGWFVDTDNNILLNVIDGERNLPFIDTPHRFNAGVLKFITEDPDLEVVISNVKEYIQLSSDLADKEQLTVNTIENKESMLRYTDTDVIRNNIKKREQLIDAYNPVQSAKHYLTQLVNLEKPKEVTSDDEKVDKIVKTYTILTSLSKVLEEQANLEAPEQGTYTDDVSSKVSSLIKYHNNLAQVKKVMCEQMQTIVKHDKCVKDLASSNEQVVKLQDELEICPLCGGGFSK